LQASAERACPLRHREIDMHCNALEPTGIRLSAGILEKAMGDETKDERSRASQARCSPHRSLLLDAKEGVGPSAASKRPERSSIDVASRRAHAAIDDLPVVPSAKTRRDGGYEASEGTPDFDETVGVSLYAPASTLDSVALRGRPVHPPRAPHRDDRVTRWTAGRPYRVRPASLLGCLSWSARQEQQQRGGHARKSDRRPSHASTVPLRTKGTLLRTLLACGVCGAVRRPPNTRSSPN
jgi:hypothetical protein